jgi:hypothetical protein
VSTSLYRNRVDGLRKEIADLESRHADERAKAVKERGEVQRALNSISRSSSPSTVASKTREAQRHDENAVRHDKVAASLANRIADKKRALSSAETSLQRAIDDENRKAERESKRRRDEELRHLQDLERRRRALQQPLLALSGVSHYGNAVGQSNKPEIRSTAEYDVCLSFAGEDRPYVEMVARGLKEQGLRVFYDQDEVVSLWGKDLAEHFDWVYRRSSRYCVMFISASYAEKAWTRHERRSALARSVVEDYEYILPARFDDTELPGLQPTRGYVDLREISPATLVEFVVEKVRAD